MSRDYKQTSVAVRRPTLDVVRALKRGQQSNDELLLSMALVCDRDTLDQAWKQSQETSYEQLVRQVVETYELDYLDLELHEDDEEENNTRYS